MSGEQKWPKKKITRKIVKRIIMGPAKDFTPDTLSDDLLNHPELMLWGVMQHENNLVDPMTFLTEVNTGDNSEALTCRVNPIEGKNLCLPSSWSERSLLDFGSDDIKAHGSRVQILSHQYIK